MTTRKEAVLCPSPLSRPATFGLRPCRSGFTLVEVLATLTLLAIILPVAMRGISLATAAAGNARRDMEAASLAEATLNELLATGAWQGSELSGDYGQDWPEYRWTAEVENWEGTVLQQVTVHVRWTTRGSEHSVTLTTLAYSGSQ